MSSAIPDDATLITMAGSKALGAALYRLAHSEAENLQRFGFVTNADHADEAGHVAGAVLTAFLETAMQCAAQSVSQASVAAVSLTCDFIAAAQAGDMVEAQVRVTRQTRTVIFLSADLFAGKQTLMVGTGVWKVVDAVRPGGR